ncbi:MAG TPA: DUF1624 domain-containing protein [Clostridiaceae bacterium]|jgi:uncharacterized membrane protein|nr:DUF1624 domain-containing protein [Clostridiaceae bacterium]HOA31061.1 heparan-alpha-glucosaminide N-acetyltransferase [Clostridia bacterium]
MAKKERIWEIDALRGLFIIFVVIIHLIFDLEYIYKIDLKLPNIYYFIQINGGVLFILISGISITLGSRCIKRGLFVLGCGLLITLVTYFLFPEITIVFGILHLLGICMLLYPTYKKLPSWVITLLAVPIVILGYVFENKYVNNPYLFMFGLTTEKFNSGDYFPLFPHLGYFMIGVVLGRLLYSDKKSLLPNFPKNNLIIRFLKFCGRHSIWIYLIHQPVIYLVLNLVFHE